MENNSSLLNKINSGSAKVAIVGVGYVGFHLAENTSKKGFNTVGIDIDTTRVTALNKFGLKRFTATSNFKELDNADIICICVPTPIDSENQPDLMIMKSAVKSVGKHLKKGHLVSIESSMASGTCRKILVPILEKQSELKAGRDFYFVYSPERVDPGVDSHDMHQIPKIVSGIDDKSRDLGTAFYGKLVPQVIPVSTLEIAELAKVVENTFRLVNISLVNELADYARAKNINIWEVIEAAATKPFGFLPHYPGPGAGGYCIPVLPYYLLDSAKKHHVPMPLIRQAAKINVLQPKKVAQIAMSLVQKPEPRILLVGISYKKDVADARSSTAMHVWKELKERGANVSYHDTHVPRMNGHLSVELSTQLLKQQDLIIITTAHSTNDYDLLVSAGVPVFDTRNVLKKYREEWIYRL